MTANQKITGRASSIPGGLALGGLISMIITVAGAMVSAWLIGNEKIREEQIGYCSMFILLASSFFGAWAASEKIKHRRLYVCILSGIIYYGLLLSITALFFGGQYQAMGVTAIVIFGSSMCAALVRPKGKRRSRSGNARHRHRKIAQIR